MLAYRLISGDSLLRARSFCPACNTTIAWFDLIPILSWILLNGKCRTCTAPISWLYWFIELLTTIFFMLLILFTAQSFWIAYALFFSALIVTIRTDLEFMLISRYVSIFLIPVGFGLSFYHFLPLSLTQSILGAFSAYCFLRLISLIFFILTKKEGMGEGDAELLAFIGAFTGIAGWWIALIIGSLFGSLYGIGHLLVTKKKESIKIPFGPFLALGGIMYVLFEHQLLWLFGF